MQNSCWSPSLGRSLGASPACICLARGPLGQPCWFQGWGSGLLRWGECCTTPSLPGQERTPSPSSTCPQHIEGDTGETSPASSSWRGDDFFSSFLGFSCVRFQFFRPCPALSWKNCPLRGSLGPVGSDPFTPRCPCAAGPALPFSRAGEGRAADGCETSNAGSAQRVPPDHAALSCPSPSLCGVREQILAVTCRGGEAGAGRPRARTGLLGRGAGRVLSGIKAKGCLVSPRGPCTAPALLGPRGLSGLCSASPSLCNVGRPPSSLLSALPFAFVHPQVLTTLGRRRESCWPGAVPAGAEGRSRGWRSFPALGCLRWSRSWTSSPCCS